MFEKAQEALKTYDWGTDPKALQPIDDAIISSHGDADARRKIEDQLTAVLKTEVSYDAKNMICRKLRVIGTAACVPTLAEFLGNEKMSHMARYALERIPADEAAAVMRDALPKLSSALKVGVLSSLGVRQDAESVPLIGQLLGDGDGAVALAAARALAAIRSPDAAKVLSESTPHEDAKAAAADASLACAESLLSDGKYADALEIYKGLLKTAPAKHVKLAVTRGMLACASKK